MEPHTTEIEEYDDTKLSFCTTECSPQLFLPAVLSKKAGQYATPKDTVWNHSVEEEGMSKSGRDREGPDQRALGEAEAPSISSGT